MQTIEEIVQYFKTNYPEIEIQEQPITALNELIAFEKERQMNTADALRLYQELDEEVHFCDDYQYLVTWINRYRTYLIFKGDTSLINTIQ